jgi:hypothetical protein
MRKATLPLITLAVGIGIGTFTDRAVHELRSRSSETKSPTIVATEDPNVFETEIDGEKKVIVMFTDTSDSLRRDPK